ncbi:MAG: PAS domain S-box protein [Candidatus Latescibacteria bacterium]|nr:PAS domain S-box protein [Candidatus Latescibacterota bacterium]
MRRWTRDNQPRGQALDRVKKYEMRLSITKQIALLLSLSVCGALLSVGVFYAFLSRTETDARFVNIAGRQRLLAEQLHDYAHMVHIGQEEGREGLRKLVDKFDQALSLLEGQGTTVEDEVLFSPQELADELARMRQLWSEYKVSLRLIAVRPAGDPPAVRAYAFIEPTTLLLIEAADQVVAEFIRVNRRLRQQVFLFLNVVAGLDVLLLLTGIWTIRNYVTERRQAEERVRSIAEGAHDSFIMMDSAGRVIDWNSRATATFGWSREEMLGRPVAELVIPPHSRQAHQEGLQRFLATGEGPVLNQRIEINALHRDGHEFPVELAITPLRWGDSYIFSAFLHDITERKRREEALKIDLAVQRVREQILQMRGVEDWRKVVVVFEHELREVIEFKDCGINLLDRQRHSYLDYETDAETIIEKKYDALPRALTQALDTGKPVYRRNRAEIDQFEDPIKAGTNCVLDVPFAGGTVAINSSEENAFSAQDIQILERFAQVMNEAHHRLEDLRNLALQEEQLHQAQKLEAIGQLATGVAHEINNPLTSVLGYGELLLRRPLDPQVRQHVETIYQEGQRAREIAERLLQFVRRQQASTQPLSLNLLVQEVLELVRQQFELDHVQLSSALAPDLPLVPAHPGQLQQLLLALLQNSREAIKKSGDAGAIKVGTRRQGHQVQLVVEDDGPGIPEGLRERIFEPFFTTKEVGAAAGAGMGLSLCYAIAREHSGHLWAEPRTAGACLVLELPAGAGAGESISMEALEDER